MNTSGESPGAQGKAVPSTYFAPAERADSEALINAVEHCSRHPMLGTILQSFGGVLAVLNAERQILAANHSLLEMLGIEDAGALLGLRPGEAIRCTHSGDHPGGCGTGQVCATCGAAIALVACQRENEPQDAMCTITADTKIGPMDMRLKVRASPFHLEGVDLILLLLEDVSLEHRRASLERAFFHDLNNLLQGLQGTAYLLDCTNPKEFEELRSQLEQQADRLAKEVSVQRVLSRLQPETHRLVPQECHVGRMLQELQKVFEHHPAAEGRTLLVEVPASEWTLRSDAVLVGRVLTNMLLNAFEASEESGSVRVWAARDERQGITFHVWNAGVIPNAAQQRIFQRYFSTKDGDGRGTGTFAMKLIGEEYLRGRVDFDTHSERGTTFRLWLPQLLPPSVDSQTPG